MNSGMIILEINSNLSCPQKRYCYLIFSYLKIFNNFSLFISSKFKDDKSSVEINLRLLFYNIKIKIQNYYFLYVLTKIAISNAIIDINKKKSGISLPIT